MTTAYLGDGVYATISASNREYPVTLTTGTHDIEQADNIVLLEKDSMDLLMILYRAAMEVKNDVRRD